MLLFWPPWISEAQICLFFLLFSLGRLLLNSASTAGRNAIGDFGFLRHLSAILFVDFSEGGVFLGWEQQVKCKHICRYLNYLNIILRHVWLVSPLCAFNSTCGFRVLFFLLQWSLINLGNDVHFVKIWTPFENLNIWNILKNLTFWILKKNKNWEFMYFAMHLKELFPSPSAMSKGLLL